MPMEPLPELTPEERLAEIAALLCKGFDRRKNRHRASPIGLEVPGETSLSVARGAEVTWAPTTPRTCGTSRRSTRSR